jgi:hypothetical protein
MVDAEDGAARHAVLAGLGQFPRLGGIVRTKLAPRAQGVLASRGGDPVLAVRPFGAGKAAAFTSTLGGAWDGEFGAWSGRLRFVSQLIRELAPPPPDGGFALRAARASSGDGASVEITARDGRGEARNLLKIRVELWAAEGSSEVPARVAAEQVGLGRYRARVPEALGRAGSRTLIARVLLAEGDAEREVLRAPVTLPMPAELLRTGVDRGALSEIVRASGGRMLGRPHELAAAIESLGGRERRDATPWAAAAALAMIILELAWRVIGGARAATKGGRP